MKIGKKLLVDPKQTVVVAGFSDAFGIIPFRPDLPGHPAPLAICLAPPRPVPPASSFYAPSRLAIAARTATPLPLPTYYLSRSASPHPARLVLPRSTHAARHTTRYSTPRPVPSRPVPPASSRHAPSCSVTPHPRRSSRHGLSPHDPSHPSCPARRLAHHAPSRQHHAFAR